MVDFSSEEDKKGAHALNLILALVTTLVAGGIALVGWNFIDSVQKREAALKNFHVTEDNAKIDSHRYDKISRDVAEHFVGNEDNPEQALQEAVFKLKSSEISFNKGLTNFDQEKYELAQINFSNTISCIPAEAKSTREWHALGTLKEVNEYMAAARDRRAICYIRLKKPALAIADLNECIKLFPNNSVYYVTRAEAYNALGKKALADADLKMASKLSRKN
jgi:tetratricopeptide (TPR) repeat protein